MSEKPEYALSIRQPWAWLICKGYKNIEYRNWELPQKYIGARIYVHASKKLDRDGLEFILNNKLPGHDAIPMVETLTYGGIVGEVTTERGIKTVSIYGEDGFILADPVLYDKPIPCRGKLGFFKPELEAQP